MERKLISANFEAERHAYEGNDNWVEKAIKDAHKCLNGDSIPEAGEYCDYCAYREAVKEVESLKY